MQASAASWGLRVAASCVVVYAVRDRFGTAACLFAMLGLSAAGFLPPVFPLLYRLYTTRVVGYRIRHALHPRLPSHSTTVFGARRLVASPDGKGPGVLIVPIPVLADNYAYIVVCERTGAAAAVDPADPHRVAAVAEALGAKLTHVLTTHKHWDHAGGNDELAAMQPGLTFVGSAEDDPAMTNHRIADGQSVHVGDVEFRAIASPGHTRGHLMYSARHVAPAVAEDARSATIAPLVLSKLATVRHLIAVPPQGSAPPAAQSAAAFAAPVPVVGSAAATRALFTGDCIFCGGCGAMFECRSAADVLVTYDTLHHLHARDAEALVYVGHEYSQRLFAEIVQRINDAGGEAAAAKPDARTSIHPDALPLLKARWAAIMERRRRLECTVPSSLRVEAATNPLMTLDRDVLCRLAADRAPASLVEQAVYGLGNRRTLAVASASASN